MATAAILNLDRGLRKGTTPLNKSPQACVQNRAYTANIFTHFLSFKNVIYTELRQGVKVSKSLQIYITLSPKFFSTPHSKWTTPNYLSTQTHLSTAVAYMHQICIKVIRFSPKFTQIASESQNILKTNIILHYRYKSSHLRSNTLSNLLIQSSLPPYLVQGNLRLAQGKCA